jgi:hypothetical protein
MTPGEFSEARVMAPSADALEADGVRFSVTGELAGERDWRGRIASGERSGAGSERSTTTG